MAAQQQIYGYFFLEKLLTQNILDDLQKSIPYQPMSDGTESAAYVYANYFLCRKITSNERISLLKAISEHFPLKLYTHHPAKELPKAEFVGPVDYYNTMPLVFQNSRINLNITLKSIQTGIPLRCMVIMGSGSFLLTIFKAIFWITLFLEKISFITKMRMILFPKYPTIWHMNQSASRSSQIV